MTVHRNTSSLLDEIEAFDANFRTLQARYPGRWVVLCDGSVVGDFERYKEAEIFAQSNLGDRSFLIEIADKQAYSPSATVWSG